MSAELPAPPAGHRWKLSKVTGDDHLGLRPFLVLKLQRRNRLGFWSTVASGNCVIIRAVTPEHQDPAVEAREVLKRFYRDKEQRDMAEYWLRQYRKTQDA